MTKTIYKDIELLDSNLRELYSILNEYNSIYNSLKAEIDKKNKNLFLRFFSLSLRYLKKEAKDIEQYTNSLNKEKNVKSDFLQQVYQMTNSVQIWSHAEDLTKKKYKNCSILYQKYMKIIHEVANYDIDEKTISKYTGNLEKMNDYFSNVDLSFRDLNFTPIELNEKHYEMIKSYMTVNSIVVTALQENWSYEQLINMVIIFKSVKLKKQEEKQKRKEQEIEKFKENNARNDEENLSKEDLLKLKRKTLENIIDEQDIKEQNENLKLVLKINNYINRED